MKKNVFYDLLSNKYHKNSNREDYSVKLVCYRERLKLRWEQQFCLIKKINS